MYTIFIFKADDVIPSARLEVRNAATVLEEITRIINDHPGCERAEVHSAAGRLFSVDCEGNTTAG